MFFQKNKELKKLFNEKKEECKDDRDETDDNEEYLYGNFVKDFKILLAKVEDLHSKQIEELKSEISILKVERNRQDERMWEIINKLVDRPPPVAAKSSLESYIDKKNSSGGGFAKVDSAAKK